MGILAVAAYVLAPTPDPAVVTAVSDGFGGMQSLIITVLVPALFGLVLLSIGIRLAIKYLKRGSGS